MDDPRPPELSAAAGPAPSMADALAGSDMDPREAMAFQAAIIDIMRVIGRSNFDLGDVLQLVIDRAAAVISEQAASIYLFRDGACRFAAGHGLNPTFEARERRAIIPPGRGTVVGRALLERRTIQIVDVHRDPEYVDKEAALAGGFNAMIAVPLLFEGHPVGVIALAHASAEPFTDRQERLLSAFGDQAAIAIERVRLLEQQRQTLEALERERTMLRTVLDNMRDGVVMWDENHNWQYANRPFCDIQQTTFERLATYRYFPDAVQAMVARNAITPDYAAGVLARFHAADGETHLRHTPAGNWVESWIVRLEGGGRLGVFRDITQLKQGEAELRAAHEATERERALMKAILDNVSDGMALFEANGDIALWNEAMFSINRFPHALFATFTNIRQVFEWQARTGQARTDDPTPEAMADRAMGWFLSGDPYVSTARRDDGQWVDVRWRVLPDGRRLITHRDVTQLKAQEAELVAAKEAVEAKGRQLITILDNLIDGVALYAPNGDILHLNKACYELNRFPREVFANITNLREGLRWQIQNGQAPMTHDDIEAELDHRMAGFFRQEVLRHQRFRYERWLDVHWLPLPDGGKVVMHRDITDLKTRELELQTAREEVEHARGLMGTVLDNMQDGVILWAPDGEWLYANKAFCDIQVTTPERLAMLRRFDTMMDALLARGLITEPFRTAAIDRFNRADGEPKLRPTHDGRWVEGAFHRLSDGSTLGVFRDITTLKQQEDRALAERDAAEDARREAEAANQAKSTFLATMSHEIRTPMNGVLGMMEVLEHQGLTEEQRASLLVMRDSGASLLRIIDDVLDFSKIEAGRMELEETPFSLSETVAGAVRALRPAAVGKGIRLASAIDPGSADALIGDPTRVRQILFNLLGNAVKFTDHGSVHVRARAEPAGEGQQRVTLTVMDTGIGMDEDQLARLFQPFAQADSSTTRRFGGTGLGLSIVRRLAQLMGGDVTVESAPDEGSVFTVTLMLRAAAADAPVTPDAQPMLLLPAGGRLLVVDDHPVNREVLIRQLGLLGIEADTAEDGIVALELWRPGRYAVVLADVHMPRMDGYGLTAAIRARERAAGASRTPIVAVTANAMRGEEERCLEAGMDAYIAKPVSLTRLREVLPRWMAVSPTDTAPAPEPSTAAIDRETLRAWMGNDTAAINGLLQRWLDSARETMVELRAAIARDDAATTSTAAHKLKGASLSVGAQAVGELASRIEAAGKASQHAVCHAALPALEAALRAAEQDVAAGQASA